jgi:Protein of unknown function (DUF4199)
MEKKTTSGVTIGIMIALVLTVLSLVIYFTKLYTETWGQYLGLCIFAGAIIWAVVNHGKERNHEATFGNLFGFGFKVAVVVTCLMILYTVLAGYLFPDVKRTIIDTAREKALSQPNVDKDQLEKGMAVFEKSYTLFIILGLIFWYLIIGAVSSLIAAGVTKKKPPFENSFNQ